MKKVLPFLILLFSGSLISQSINLSEFSSGFNWLIGIANSGDERMFGIQKTGEIYVIDETGNRLPSPFLAITSKVRHGSNDERGLLGLAFHPEYESNGFFYVYYTKAVSGNISISRFSRSSNDANKADPNSEVELLSFPHSRFNHVGGALAFGPDGYLYAGVGDGGGSGDPDRAGQDLSAFHGKILRIDVSNGTAGVPSDNPFINTTGARPEIWAYGLRNPWRIAFDRWTGDLWIADVGQDKLEEVNVQLGSNNGGENYGWSCREGTAIFSPSQCTPGLTLQDPIFEYPHVNGNCGGSVSGGVAYRGMKYGDLFGNYFFADFCTGVIYMVDKAGNSKDLGTFDAFEYTTLGENSFGEMFLTGYFSNKVYAINSDNLAPTAFITNGTNVSICDGDSVRLGAYNIPGANMSFRWLFNGNPINGANSPALFASEVGEYQVIVKNEENGAEGTSGITTLLQTNTITTTVDETIDVGTQFQGVLITGDTSFVRNFQSSFGCDSLVTYNINGFTNAHEIGTFVEVLEVTPNPFLDILSIDFELSETTEIRIDLYDFQGNLVENILENQKFVNGRHSFKKDLNCHSSGFYYLFLTTNRGVLSRKVLKI